MKLARSAARITNMNESSLLGNYTKLEQRLWEREAEIREIKARMVLLAVAYWRKTGLRIR